MPKRGRTHWKRRGCLRLTFPPHASYLRTRSYRAIFFPNADRVRRPVQTGRRDREDLVAGRGHPDRVLELRRQRTILGDRGPPVAENFDLVAPGVDHRLDREEHAFAQPPPLLRGAVMQDRGGVGKTPPPPRTPKIPPPPITLSL